MSLIPQLGRESVTKIPIAFRLCTYFHSFQALGAINAILPEYVGLYSISNVGIQKKRREKLNRYVQKYEMLISIPSAAVKNKFSIKGKLTSDEIRSVAMKKSYKSIHDYFINYYIEKLSARKSTNNTKTPITSIEDEEDYIIIDYSL